jgi:hypothetical protein
MRLMLATTAFVFTLAACSDDEAPPEGHGSPESVQLYDGETGTALPQPYALPSGTTTRVEVVFFDADGENINSELEPEHFSSLTFDPASFATVTPVAGEKFLYDVLVNADPGATAAATVGYGHDEAADESTFGPYTVTASEGAPAVRTAIR